MMTDLLFNTVRVILGVVCASMLVACGGSTAVETSSGSSESAILVQSSLASSVQSESSSSLLAESSTPIVISSVASESESSQVMSSLSSQVQSSISSVTPVVVSSRAESSSSVALIPKNMDQCDTTAQCKALWPAADDCSNSQSNTSICLCDGVRCDSIVVVSSESSSGSSVASVSDPEALKLMGLDGYGTPADIAVVLPDQLALDDLKKIEQRYVSAVLGRFAPSSGDYDNAKNEYNKLNIKVSGNSISGNSPSADAAAIWLLNLARQAYHNNDDAAWTMASNTLWLIAANGFPDIWYSSRDFYKAFSVIGLKMNSAGRKAVYAALNAEKIFPHKLMLASDSDWMNPPKDYFNVANTDTVYLASHAYLGFALFHTHNDVERLAYVKNFVRWYDRVLMTTPGTFDFVKPDGTVFHHWTHTTQYIYTWNVIGVYFDIFKDVSFKMKRQSYEQYRDAAYAQGLIAMKQTFSNANATRFPLVLNVRISDGTYKKIAQLSSSYTDDDIDDLTGTYYNQNIKDELEGIDPDLSMEGFYQFYYAALGVFRKDNYMVNMKGFNKSFWGTEIYADSRNANNYGRYQAYGILDVIYSGGAEESGYTLDGYDWNRPSGSTTIVLPWKDLIANSSRQDERIDSNFTAALRFDAVENGFRGIEGKTGMFAFDFRQRNNSPTHDTSFTFKKSYYVFDDVIVALGSGINNNDAVNATVTTLHQAHLGKAKFDLNIEGDKTSALPFSKTFNGGSTWYINEYGTGFFIPDAKGLIVKRLNHESPDPLGGNKSGNISVATIEHGKKPSGGGYEYVMMPEASEAQLKALKNNGLPYEVKQKNDDAHIIHHSASDTYGYALFKASNDVSHGVVGAVSRPVMIMAREKDTLKMTVVNPDLGVEYRQYEVSAVMPVSVTLKGNYELLSEGAGVSVEFKGMNTVLTFNTQHAAPVDFELRKL